MEDIEKDVRGLIVTRKGVDRRAFIKGAAATGAVVAAANAVKMYVPILKLAGEKQEITGVVLQPEIVDAQGDIISAEVIEKAAGDFLAGFNVNKELGLMHKDFKQRFELRQSFITPSDMTIGNKVVKAGSWVMVVKVNDATIWKKIKDGELTGFSIGGKAKVQKLAA